MPRQAERALFLADRDDTVSDRAFTEADKILKASDRLAHAKYEGLARLDEFNDIMVTFGSALFWLGVKHGARRK
jgi:hypothetical protein